MSVENDFLNVIRTRRSHRSFTDTPVDKEVIESIIDCGRMAATARNLQPWKFVVIQNQKTRTQIADLTTAGKFIAESPVCIAVFCKDTKYYLEDGSAATQNILLAARYHNLGACWVAGDKKDYCDTLRDMFSLSQNYRLVSLIALGHPCDNPNPPKRPLEEQLMRFGDALSILPPFFSILFI